MGSGVQVICRQASQDMAACWVPWRMKRLLKEHDEGMEWWVALFCWCLDEASRKKWDLCTVEGAVAALVYLWESSCDNQDCLHALPHVPWRAESLLVENHSSKAELQMAGQPLCHPACLPPHHSATWGVRPLWSCRAPLLWGRLKQHALNSGMCLFFMAVTQ